MSIIVNTVYASASCACGMDATNSETGEMMNCHMDEAQSNNPVKNTPTANDCCPACIVLYPAMVDLSLVTDVPDSEPVVFIARDIVTQNITPLYRPPITSLL